MHSVSTSPKENGFTGLVEKDAVEGAVAGVLLSAKTGISRRG